MKILNVVEGFGGGVYSFLVDLCNKLSCEYEIIIVYNIREQTPENFKEDFNKNIKFININMSREINIMKDFKALLKIYKIIGDEKPDIIHLHSSKAGVLGRVAAQLRGYNNNNVFYNPHGYAFLQKNVSASKRKIYFYIEKFMRIFCGTIITVSKGEYLETKKFTKKVVRIDNSIDITDLKDMVFEKEDKEIKVIGTLGRITYQKNPRLFNLIAEEFPNIRFKWIGDGDLRSELKSKNIEITGWKERQDAIKELNDIDIYIQTSLWEGLPIALLEVMYFSKAVVVTNVIGNNDVIINGVNGFVANNIEEFKNYINRFIEDKELYTKISNNAKTYIIDNHSIEDMVNKYKELYRQ